eukprot:15451581-Alexandrium_andersonii.AAC.1
MRNTVQDAPHPGLRRPSLSPCRTCHRHNRQRYHHVAIAKLTVYQYRRRHAHAATSFAAVPR